MLNGKLWAMEPLFGMGQDAKPTNESRNTEKATLQTP